MMAACQTTGFCLTPKRWVTKVDTPDSCGKNSRKQSDDLSHLTDFKIQDGYMKINSSQRSTLVVLCTNLEIPQPNVMDGCMHTCKLLHRTSTQSRQKKICPTWSTEMAHIPVNVWGCLQFIIPTKWYAKIFIQLSHSLVLSGNHDSRSRKPMVDNAQLLKRQDFTDLALPRYYLCLFTLEKRPELCPLLWKKVEYIVIF